MSRTDGKTRWYLAACAGLLLLAAALRFYGLPQDDLSHDEAVAVYNSKGTVAETIRNTRYSNSSPILYPLALWAVQKVESSPASLRALPAAASVATVAVILLLLPRLGFSRRAALLAALLLTLSVPAIEHAQGVREYSIDALWAALLTAALLGYSQTGRKAPLAGALLLAPLIQYGLALFGAAVIAAALFIPLPPDSGPRQSHRGGWRRWGFLADGAGRRLGLLYPAAGFAAGCAVSWWATYRFHRDDEAFGRAGYLSEHYYQGAYNDAAALGEFIYEKTLNFLQHHLPQAEALLPLTGAALLLWGLAAAWRRFSSRSGPAAGVNPPGGEISGAPRWTADRTLVILGCFGMAAAVAAAALRLYPFGGLRQTVYLAPVIFLILGLGLHRASSGLALLARWRWAPAGTLALAVGLMAWAGFADLQQRDPYRVSPSLVAAASAELQKRAQFNEATLIPWRYVAALDFQQGGRPANQRYGVGHCDWLSTEDMECLRKLLDGVDYADRIALVHSNGYLYTQAIPLRLQEWRPGAEVERIDLEGDLSLYIVTNFDRGARRPIDSGPPAVRSVFDLYLFGNQVYYVQEPCRREEVAAPFFLHIVPDNAGDLPPDYRERGFEHRGFQWKGTEIKGRCVEAVRLPGYPIAKIRTGQYLPGQGDLWRETFPGPGRELRRPSGELLARGVFDLYRDGDELHYAKEPCGRADLEPMFFLHIVPADGDDLPPEGREAGFQGLDFRWNGERLYERCIATERLPGYPIARIHTGQYIPAQGESGGQGELWREEIAVAAPPP